MPEAVTETQAADTLTKGPAPFSLSAPESPEKPAASLPDTLEARSKFYDEELKKIIGDLGAKTAVADKGIAEAESQYGQTVESVVKPAMARAKEQYAKPGPPLPTQIPTPPQPDISARPFNASHKDALGSVVQTLGLMAQMAFGAGKAPKAALGAFTGAMQGWAEGDSIRAERDWKSYLGAVDTIRQENRQALLMWDAASRQHGQNEQAATAALSVSLAEAGFAKDAIAVAEKGRTRALQDFATQRQEIDGLWQRSLDLEKLRVQSEGHRATQAWHEEQMAARWADLRRKESDDRQRADDRQASLADRQLARQQLSGHRSLMEQLMLQSPQGSFYWDKDKGEVTKPSRGELIQNRENFTPLQSQQAPLIERLAVAAPILRRIDRIIDKVNAVEPGVNLTQGTINRLKQKAGIEADLIELQSLSLDQALEIASALSGGTPRISILYMLRGEATPQLTFTRDAAKRSVDTGRITISNRLTSMTHDPKAFDKASRGLQEYQPEDKPGAPAAASELSAQGWKIEVVK